MKKCERGFTILEVTLVTAISTIIIFGIFGIFQTGNDQAQQTQVKMTLEESTREALYKMAQEIRQTSPNRPITIGANGISLQFEVPDPASLIDASYAINWAGAHTIRYARGGPGNLQLQRTDTTTNRTSVIANDITAIQFARNGSVITITLSAQRTLINGRLVPVTPLQMTAQAEMRNP